MKLETIRVYVSGKKVEITTINKVVFVQVNDGADWDRPIDNLVDLSELTRAIFGYADISCFNWATFDHVLDFQSLICRCIDSTR